MKKNLAIILLSVILSGLTAFFVAKYVQKQSQGEGQNYAGQPVKTVNLSVEDYPDFTYAAENTVDAVVYVQVKVKSRAQLNNPFFEFFFGDQ